VAQGVSLDFKRYYHKQNKTKQKNTNKEKYIAFEIKTKNYIEISA
jgi:hypothetical protein